MRVLRKREGDTIPAVTAAGTKFSMKIEGVGRASCRVALVPSERDPLPGLPRIQLLQCLPKGRKMDLIVRQAVEAGAAAIVPIASEHCVAVPEDPAGRLARWRRIAREALQQSGNPRLPSIEEPRPISRAAELLGQRDTGLFFHQERTSEGFLHSALACVDPSATISLLIGPEGGLSKAEAALLDDSGFIPVFLGDAVLRTETAAIFAIAAVQTLLRERDTWTLSQQR